MYSVMKNDKVNNWSQEKQAITPLIEVEHIKGKDYVLGDLLSWLTCLDSHDEIDPEESGQEYGKSVFGTDENTINSLDSDQN